MNGGEGVEEETKAQCLCMESRRLCQAMQRARLVSIGGAMSFSHAIVSFWLRDLSDLAASVP